MNPHQYEELERLRIKNVELNEDKYELRKLLGLVCENRELRTTRDDKECKAHCIHVPRRAHSKERGKKDRSPSCRDSKHVQYFQRVVGESAFQLNRRILARIFDGYERFYGFSVANIKNKILQITTCALTNKVDEAERSRLFERRHKLFNTLKLFGYDKNVHPTFTEYLVNTYGVLKSHPLPGVDQLGPYNCPAELKRMAAESMPCSDLDNVSIIIDCLAYLAEQDGKPLFIS